MHKHAYKFYNMKNRPLEYPVKCGSKVMIPKGATNVKIAFGQSTLSRFDEATQSWVKMNVYLYKGKLYHA